MYKAISLGTSILAGLLAGQIFQRVWRLTTREDEAPKATDADRSWTEVLAAAALQGAVFGAVRAAVERGTAAGTRRLTGTWPGDEDQQPSREKEHAG
jgi:hypothetical protein